MVRAGILASVSSVAAVLEKEKDVEYTLPDRDGTTFMAQM
jgi:hypothetical protein